MTLKALPRSARSLHRRRLTWQGYSGRGLSIFPLFTPLGHVTDLLIIAPVTGDLYLLPWLAGGALRGLWRRLYFEDVGAVPVALEQDDLDRIDQRLHYDPWWLLDAPAFASHWAVGPLKRTNCVSYLPSEVKTLLYQRDLNSVSNVLWQEKEGHCLPKAWYPDLLSRPAEEEAPAVRMGHHGACVWRLDPIWQPDRRDPWGI